MARVIVTGAGIGGLTTALLLARDGHEVTVLERDPAPPPASADAAWAGWERRGVNQFRLLHFFLARFRAIFETELPEVVDGLESAGALRLNFLRMVPDALSGGYRQGDDDYELLTGRRPVMEATMARVADESAGVRIERGTAVTGLLTGRPVDGIPRVVGVRTETGSDLAADLVVDTTGRRSPLPSWLEAIGAPAPREEREDSGFVYYGRHFRSTDGTLPPSFGPNLQHYESISFLTLPADNGTWGVGIVTSAADGDLRVLRHVDRWAAVIAAYPLLAHWAQGEPLEGGVAVMAKIEDRRREFDVDGQPLATGVVAVGDSWACTNPSVGRGASLAALHAVGLRDHLRTTPVDEPLAFARGWIDVTEATVAPFYRETLHFDRHRLAEIDAQIRGEPYEPGDPAWESTNALGVGSSKDPDLLRGALAIGLVLRTAADVFADPAFAAKVDANGGNWRNERAPGPSRSELLAIAGA